MTKAIRLIEQLSGEQLIYLYDKSKKEYVPKSYSPLSPGLSVKEMQKRLREQNEVIRRQEERILLLEKRLEHIEKRLENH